MGANPRFKIYTRALVAIGTHPCPSSCAEVQAFLDDTKAEDEWLLAGFIDGSPALLMRSMLAEVGTIQEKKIGSDFDFGKVRKALQDFVSGTPIPEELRFAAQVSIRYWKGVAFWQEGIRESLAKLGVFPK